MPGNRISIRLKNYDYAQAGAYFVTICVHGRQCLFGDVRNGKMILNDEGKMIADNWNQLPQRFPNIEMDEYIVMPNHLHGIINIVGEHEMDNDVGAGFPRPRKVGSNTDARNNYDKGRGNRAPTLGQIVAYFKYGTTKQINAILDTPGVKLWQRNFYEHIIRDESDLARVREYIVNNPAGWEKDEYYTTS